MLDQNWIRDLFRSTGYPIRPPSKIYEENQAIIKKDMGEIIAPQSRPLDVLITALQNFTSEQKLNGGHNIKHATCRPQS